MIILVNFDWYGTAEKLKKMDIITVLLSTHPHPPEEADSIINHKVKHFKLNKFFNEIHATRKYHGSKGEFIAGILKATSLLKVEF